MYYFWDWQQRGPGKGWVAPFITALWQSLAWETPKGWVRTTQAPVTRTPDDALDPNLLLSIPGFHEVGSPSECLSHSVPPKVTGLLLELKSCVAPCSTKNLADWSQWKEIDLLKAALQKQERLFHQNLHFWGFQCGKSYAGREEVSREPASRKSVCQARRCSSFRGTGSLFPGRHTAVDFGLLWWHGPGPAQT